MYELDELEERCKAFVAAQMHTDSAHDLAHLGRVVAQAKQLAQEEGAEESIVVAAAWLHDSVNYPKNHPNRGQASRESAAFVEPFLVTLGFSVEQIDAVQHAIIAHSFSAQVTPESLEAKIVQDADRLDALGAIGIARCMMVGGQLSRALYALEDPFCVDRAPDDSAYTLDHFYQKLLCLAQTFQTKAGIEEASRRSVFMREYLDQLKREIS